MAASNKRPSTRKPAVLQPSTSRSLKTAWKKSGKRVSLKQYARQTNATAWLHNKKANTSKPELCIGRTRSRVKKGGGGKGKDLSGK